jgi:hypothetical protein
MKAEPSREGKHARVGWMNQTVKQGHLACSAETDELLEQGSAHSLSLEIRAYGNGKLGVPAFGILSRAYLADDLTAAATAPPDRHEGGFCFVIDRGDAVTLGMRDFADARSKAKTEIVRSKPRDELLMQAGIVCVHLSKRYVHAAGVHQISTGAARKDCIRARAADA